MIVTDPSKISEYLSVQNKPSIREERKMTYFIMLTDSVSSEI